MSIKLLAISTLVLILVFLLLSGTLRFQFTQSDLIRVSFIAAFLGGALALISPCSAALLPAFFAYSFKAKKELLKMTFVFYLGLALVFVPLGFSATLISKLFVTQKTLFLNIIGAVFILLAILIFFSKSFSLLPKRFGKMPVPNSGPTVFLTGVFSAFASGTCAAPIIGGIFTLASTSGNSLEAILLLLTFAFGMTLPLFILAFFFEKYNFAGSKIVQGKLWQIKIGRRDFYLHSTNLIASILFLILGIIFITTKGTNVLLGIFGNTLFDFYYKANEVLLRVTRPIPNWIFYLLGVIIIISIIIYKRRRKKNI